MKANNESIVHIVSLLGDVQTYLTIGSFVLGDFPDNEDLSKYLSGVKGFISKFSGSFCEKVKQAISIDERVRSELGKNKWITFVEKNQEYRWYGRNFGEIASVTQNICNLPSLKALSKKKRPSVRRIPEEGKFVVRTNSQDIRDIISYEEKTCSEVVSPVKPTQRASSLVQRLSRNNK